MVQDAAWLMRFAEQQVENCAQSSIPRKKENGSSQPQQPTTPACANLMNRHHPDRRPATIRARPWEIEETDSFHRISITQPA